MNSSVLSSPVVVYVCNLYGTTVFVCVVHSNNIVQMQVEPIGFWFETIDEFPIPSVVRVVRIGISRDNHLMTKDQKIHNHEP